MQNQIIGIKSVVSMGLLVGMTLTLLGIVAYRGSDKANPEIPAAQSASMPRIRIHKKAEVSIGGSSSFTIDLDENGNGGPFAPMSGIFGEYITMYAVNGECFVIGTFSNAEKKGHIDGKSVHYPSGWDFNSDEDGVEVVDESGIPVLQIIALDRSRIFVNGCFTTIRDDSVVLNQDIMVINPEGGVKQHLVKLKPVFRHPGKEFPQQRVGLFENSTDDASTPAHAPRK